MARYSVLGQRTASTTLAALSTTADATRPRRGKWYYADFGAEAAAADNPFLWQVQRCTAAGTSTGVTPQPLDFQPHLTQFRHANGQSAAGLQQPGIVVQEAGMLAHS